MQNNEEASSEQKLTGDSYVAKQINKYSHFSTRDEIELHKLIAQGDEDAINALVGQNISILKEKINSLKGKNGVQYDELFNEGWIILWKAALDWNPEKGDFAKRAKYILDRQLPSVVKYLTNSVSFTEYAERTEKKQATGGYGDAELDSEFEKSNKTLGRYVDFEDWSRSQADKDADSAEEYGSNDAQASGSNWLAESQETNAYRLLADLFEEAGVRPRDREIVLDKVEQELRREHNQHTTLADNKLEVLSTKEIAARYNLGSEQRVNQIYRAALSQLKRVAEEHGLTRNQRMKLVKQVAKTKLREAA